MLFDKMRKNMMTANVIRFNMRESSMVANVIIFSAAISTCEQGGTLLHKMSITGCHKMRKAGMTGNAISFITAISAYKRRGQWERTFALLHRLREPA